MKKDRKIWQFLSCTTLILLATSIAQASIVSVGPTLSTTANDSADWSTFPVPTPPGGSDLGSCIGTISCGPLTFTSLTTPHNTLTLSFTDGQDGQVWVQQTIPGAPQFNGHFTDGQYLVNTLDSLAPATADSFTIQFGSGVSAFGVYVEEFDFSNPFTATVSTADGGGGSYTSPSGSNNVEWVGIADSGGIASINSVTITTTGTQSGYFLVGTAYFQSGNTTTTGPPPSVPEPASMFMVAGGIAALVWKARKRARA